MPKGIIDKPVHIVWWERDTYQQDGRTDEDWDMLEQKPLDEMIESYIDDADGGEDQPLSEIEKARLRDFALYMKHRL